MGTRKVVVNFADAPSYDVRIGSGLVEGLGRRIASTVEGASSALVVDDSHTGPLYGQAVRASLKEAGIACAEVTVEAGEQSKCVDVLAELWDAMAAQRIDREGVVVALGGGVVGDLAGFAAASYLRGIHLVQVPTSLLAMVDSSVGGKTAIDLDAGKNLVGAFKQPDYVCADTDLLATLPEREWACGCAEIAKSALIDSDDFFFWLVEHAADLQQRDAEVCSDAICRSVVFKANVVASDPFETAGARVCLNYGHTLGHAIEKLAGFGTFSHGAAVAEGMRFAARLASSVLGTPVDLVREQDALLDALCLPALGFSADPGDVIDAMRADKKNKGGRIRFVLPADVGAWELCEVEEGLLREHVDAWSRSKEG